MSCLTSQFVAHNSKKLIEDNEKQNAWTRSCAQVFKKLCEKYDDMSDDALARVNKQVNVVKLQMTENIGSLVDDVELNLAKEQGSQRDEGIRGTLKDLAHAEDRENVDIDDDFNYSHSGLSSHQAAERLAKYGRNELAEVVVPLWYIFVSQLWQPMPLMIWLAAIVEGAIHGYPDMGILLVIQFANASIGFYEITKAGDAVAALRASLKPVATVKRDGAWKNIDAAGVVPGDLVLLANGSAVPADCRINPREEGSIAMMPTIDVDQAALTGKHLCISTYK
jgi:magnesium-transporting ATPase (P-type)